MNRITSVYSLELLRWSLSQPYNRRRASAGPGAWRRTAQPATNNVRAPDPLPPQAPRADGAKFFLDAGATNLN